MLFRSLYLSFIGVEGEHAKEYNVTLELTASNRRLPTRLGVGDVCVTTDDSPTFATFRNISRPTAPIPPPLGADAYWRMLAHLAIDYRSLADIDAVRGLLVVYDFPARVDRQAERFLRILSESIVGASATPGTRLFRGAPVRGVNVELLFDEERLTNEGERFLFGTIFNAIVADAVSLNAYSQLVVRGTKSSEEVSWPPRLGQAELI